MYTRVVRFGCIKPQPRCLHCPKQNKGVCVHGCEQRLMPGGPKHEQQMTILGMIEVQILGGRSNIASIQTPAARTREDARSLVRKEGGKVESIAALGSVLHFAWTWTAQKSHRTIPLNGRMRLVACFSKRSAYELFDGPGRSPMYGD